MIKKNTLVRKNFYKYKSLVILPNGASTYLNTLNNLNNYQIFIDNYNSNYLNKLGLNTNTKIFNKTSTYSFLKKYQY